MVSKFRKTQTPRQNFTEMLFFICFMYDSLKENIVTLFISADCQITEVITDRRDSSTT